MEKKETLRQETKVEYTTEGRFHDDDEWSNYHGPCDTLRQLALDLRYTKKDMESLIKKGTFCCPMSEIAIQIRSVKHTKITIKVSEPSNSLDLETIKPFKNKIR